MSLDDIAKAFKDAFPKAIDFPVYEHDYRAADISSIAALAGYRLAGKRLERAVFTTKAQK